ncbi:MAG: response regulator transcription factor, partial [Clostridia bacterium]|nr:response regulator transcription factor [Clostridia bacterium]
MKRILVIEDDLDIRDIVAFNLEREGYEVALASDGEEGLLTFARHTFDLVILDIMMPKLNGLKVLESIRSRSDVPVLIMSAKTSEEDRLEGLSRMADDYICKPFSMKELLLRVKNHLYRYDRNSGVITWGEYTIDENSGVVRR